jgi:hypothetical protein
LLDQDTWFDSQLPTLISENIKKSGLKLICPTIFSNSNKVLSPYRKFYTLPIRTKVPQIGNIKLHNYAIINSGICISLELFLNADGYNEKVFLDFSDYEFLNRLSKFYDQAFIYKSDTFQDYSSEDLDIDKTLIRFSLFCKSLKNCISPNFIENMFYKIVVLKRTLSVLKTTKKTSVFKILINNYFHD